MVNSGRYSGVGVGIMCLLDDLPVHLVSLRPPRAVLIVIAPLTKTTKQGFDLKKR